jgi:hypothetical protein
MHLGRFHLGGQFATGIRIVTAAWIAIYILVPVLMLIVLAVQARTRGIDPPRSAPLPVWLYGVLAAQAIVFLAVGIGLFTAPRQAAPLWPWKLTPLVAQATAAWLISLGAAAAQALLERDARRLRPAAVGYLLLAVLQAVASARYPHQFHWGNRRRNRVPDLPRRDGADRRRRSRPRDAARRRAAQIPRAGPARQSPLKSPTPPRRPAAGAVSWRPAA